MNEQLDYIQQLEQQIAEAQTSLDGLKTRRDRIVEQAQHEEIERLERHLADARVKSQDLSHAAAEAWQDLKASIDELMQQLQDGLQKLSQ